MSRKQKQKNTNTHKDPHRSRGCTNLRRDDINTMDTIVPRISSNKPQTKQYFTKTTREKYEWRLMISRQVRDKPDA